MLILSRRTEETIVIDNHRITIRVLSIEPDRVRLGIAAPAEVPVHRGEIQQIIDDARREREEGGGPWQ